MSDFFAGFPASMESPAARAFAVVPHATDPLPVATRAIYVGAGGDLVVRLVEASADVTFTNLPGGSILPVRASHVRATSSASNLVGLL